MAADFTGLTVAPAAGEKVVVTLDPKDAKQDRIQIKPAKAALPSSAL